MAVVGVWEQSGAVGRALSAAGIATHSGAHPADLAGRALDLLVVAPDARGWGGASALHCRIALLPGAAGSRAGTLRAESAVSYGTSAKNSITLSSLEGGRIVLALQRELVTVSGAVVERQELPLACPEGRETDEFLCVTGALILLGKTPA